MMEVERENNPSLINEQLLHERQQRLRDYPHELMISLSAKELETLGRINQWIFWVKMSIVVFGIIGTIAHLFLLIYTERWILLNLLNSTGNPGSLPRVLPDFAVFEIFMVLVDVLLIVLKIRVLYFLSSYHYAFNPQGMGWASGTMFQITALRIFFCSIGFWIMATCDLTRITEKGFWLLVFSCGLGNLIFECLIWLGINHARVLLGEQKGNTERIRQLVLFLKKRLYIGDFKKQKEEPNQEQELE